MIKAHPAALRVLYATSMDPHDVRAWSGTVRFIAQSLERNDVDVQYLGELQRRRMWMKKAINRMQQWFAPDQIFPVERTLSMARRFADEIASKLPVCDCRLVFSPSSIPIALLKCDRPKVFYTDATFAGILDLYPEYRNYPKRYIEQGHYLEREALRNCDLAIYSSPWAARTAVEHYGADPGKLRVVPFGCNLDSIPDRTLMEASIKGRQMERCELLFLGVAWERKGGDIALRTAERLHAQGVPVRLTIVGCEPTTASSNNLVEVHPFISKNTTEGQQRLSGLIQRSHFLLLPTRADCSPIVYSESNAFGVPCITTDVGGTTGSIREGVNGHALPLSAGEDAYAEVITRYFTSPSDYRKLALSALAEHHDRLNWSATGRALLHHMGGLVAERV